MRKKTKTLITEIKAIKTPFEQTNIWSNRLFSVSCLIVLNLITHRMNTYFGYKPIKLIALDKLID